MKIKIVIRFREIFPFFQAKKFNVFFRTIELFLSTDRLLHFGSIFFFLFFPFFVFAQTETTIVGQVFDKFDKTPLSSVNIYFKNTNTGTTSNNEGYFLIRSWEPEKILVFSSVGYKAKEVKIKPGQPAYLNVELEEQNTWLEDVFVLPGINPALEWMKKIRLVRKENDIANYPDYNAKSIDQELIFLSRLEENALNKRLYNQLKIGSLAESDSSLVIPLYMAESTNQITNKGKNEVSRNVFSTPEITDNLVAQISKGIQPELNFYENSVVVFGKSIISPLASIGNTYYNYYLADSIRTENGKQYEIHFYSKNEKNLAFNGKFRFDSLSLALTYIEAELPRKANINYVRGLSIKQEFDVFANNRWAKRSGELTVSMTYDLIADSVNLKPIILIKQTSDIDMVESFTRQFDNFAKSEYASETLEDKLQELDNTPLMRTAKWIADAALTGYARAGFIDVGRLQQIIRLTDLEGIRLAIPLRTNERLWSNISIGGYVGYAFRNKEVKYSMFGQFRLPTKKRRVFEISYTDDNRRVDYNYNSFIERESPWSLGDEDAVNTILSLVSAPKISPRKEWMLSYANDWNKNIESMTLLRFNELFSNDFMPMSINDVELSSLRQQSLTFVTRFSFDEKKYEDHLQRIYVQNRKPVVYATLETGRFQINGGENYYGKIIGSIKQNIQLNIGQWNYLAETGFVFGRVPYPFLEFSAGNEPSGISFYQFNRMKYMEFGYDKYVQLNNEFIFNGILFNHIPLIKHLNLRELVQLKVVFGGLSDRHRELLDFPDSTLYPHYLRKLQNPYIEGGIGITNVFRIFTVQLNYRFTNVYDGITPWRISTGLRFGF